MWHNLLKGSAGNCKDMQNLIHKICWCLHHNYVPVIDDHNFTCKIRVKIHYDLLGALPKNWWWGCLTTMTISCQLALTHWSPFFPCHPIILFLNNYVLILKNSLIKWPCFFTKVSKFWFVLDIFIRNVPKFVTCKKVSFLRPFWVLSTTDILGGTSHQRPPVLGCFQIIPCHYKVECLHPRKIVLMETTVDWCYQCEFLHGTINQTALKTQTDKLDSYTPHTLRAYCSKSDLTILKRCKSSVLAFFCTIAFWTHYAPLIFE